MVEVVIRVAGCRFDSGLRNAPGNAIFGAMTKVISTLLLAIAGFFAAGPAAAQWHNSAQFDRDLRACDRRGVNFERCMWERG
ncbi:MAG TPA: hypothetical protein VGK33_23320, partial [Chloroflexota bacterium]